MSQTQTVSLVAARGGAWPEGWGRWLDDGAWRQSMARAIEERDTALLSSLCECWIGLECHARLDTGRKLFCALPEGSAGWVDIGLPGALPVLDLQAAKLASDLGLALGATLAERFGFERKRYAYPDLSKGYQTTQKAMCVWFGGSVRWDGGSLPLDRAQIEEDAAKVRRGAAGFEMDFGRAGSPLLEIVSVAAPLWPEDAALALRGLWREAIHSGATQGRIEEGHFKSDVNISLRPRGSEGLGERVEVKGVGSFDFARRAGEDVVWMLARELLEAEPRPKRTYGFDESTMACEPMREKAADCDYKFLPDGDLSLRGRVDARARLGWMDARAALRDAFGTEAQTEALWDDPRKSRTAIEAGPVGLASAGALGHAQSGAIARAFFARVEKSLLDRAPEAGGKALAWACRQVEMGAKRARAVDAALGAWTGLFDAIAAERGLGEEPEFPESIARSMLDALLETDAKARAAMEQARSGRPKALGYIFGAMAERWGEGRLDKEALSSWLAACGKPGDSTSCT